MAALGRRPQQVTWSDLPDDLQSRIFHSITNPDDTAACRLVCADWRDKAVHTWEVEPKDGQPTREEDIRNSDELLALISRCHNLRVLGDFYLGFHTQLSVVAFLHCVAASCPLLEAFSINLFGLTEEDLKELALDRLFGRCRGLQKLTLQRCNFWFIAAAPSNFQHLQRLDPMAMASLEALPDGLANLAQLREFTVTVDDSLNVWGPLAGFTQLKELRLELEDADDFWEDVDDDDVDEEVPCFRLPDEVWQLTGLESLSLCALSLPALPRGLGRMTALHSLKVSSTRSRHALTGLPPTFSLLTGLTSLELEKCELTGLPFSWGDLSSLTELRLVDAFANTPDGVEHINRALEPLGNLCHNLRVLRLEQPLTLLELPSSFTQLQHLEELELTAHALADLPEEFGRLTSLRKLQLQGCRSQNLPQSLGQLKALQELRLVRLKELSSLPQSLGGMTAMEWLDIAECPALEDLPDSIGCLARLEHVSVWYCSNIPRLPDSLGNLSRLRDLTLENCATLGSLPESIGDLQSLKCLTLKRLPALAGVPDWVPRMTGLRRLTVENCGPQN